MHASRSLDLLSLSAVFLTAVVATPCAAATATRHACIRQTCKAQRHDCIAAFHERSQTSRASCASRATRHKRQRCRRREKHIFRNNKRACGEAFKKCRQCCRHQPEAMRAACSVTLCGDGIRVAGEECDGADSGACPGLCRQDCTCAVCDCCAAPAEFVGFSTVTPPVASVGELRDFRCSNARIRSCAHDTDCALGTCDATFGRCIGDFRVACASDDACSGTCEEASVRKPLADLDHGIYFGGGRTGVQLPVAIPPEAITVSRVTGCDVGAGGLSLGPTEPEDITMFGLVGRQHCTSGRRCEVSATSCVVDGDCPDGERCQDRCFIAPPLPFVSDPATSVCIVLAFGKDASGSLECNGELRQSLPLRAAVYLTGDLFKESTPPDIPKIQPCPLCTRVCVGGANARFPCADDSECASGQCSSSMSCLGGVNDGNACTIDDIAQLGEDIKAAPSQDCLPYPSKNVTASIAGLPIDVTLTTGAAAWNAVDHDNGSRVFAGFCSDVASLGSGCFAGDPSTDCPNGTDPHCQPAGGDVSACGLAVPCTADSDCEPPYESCVQRSPGAFAMAQTTRIEVRGATDGECIADFLDHDLRVVSLYTIPPVFTPILDATGDLPGPGAAIVASKVLLIHPLLSLP